MRHEVSEGWIGKVKLGIDQKTGKDRGESSNYFMWLAVDGKTERRKTGTDDEEKAYEMLENWKADLVRGIDTNSNLKYGDIRRAYLAEKPVKVSALRDLDEFFGKINVNSIEYSGLKPEEVKPTGMRLSLIDRDAMIQFRTARESRPEVTGYEQEQVEKELALRVRKALAVNGGKELPKKELSRLKDESTTWVKNGTRATTNTRLILLRAMFYHAAEVANIIKSSDIPSFPLWPIDGKGGCDNKKKGFLTVEQFEELVDELPKDLHNLVRFIYTTGLRSGAARQVVWEMIDDDATILTIPGEIMKNSQPLTLPLIKKNGQPLFAFITGELKRKSTGLIFTLTEARLRNEWRKACHKLGHGVFDRTTRSYRGLSLHDFRRSAARNMRKKGNSESVIMSVTGHKTSSTFKRYDIVEMSDKIAALE